MVFFERPLSLTFLILGGDPPPDRHRAERAQEARGGVSGVDCEAARRLARKARTARASSTYASRIRVECCRSQRKQLDSARDRHSHGFQDNDETSRFPETVGSRACQRRREPPCVRAGRQLADTAGQADHSLCAGRRERHHRPPLGGRAEPVVRPAVRDREPRRRRRHDRRGGGVEGRARRLHVPADAVGGDVGAAAAATDALRSAEEFRAGRRASATASPASSFIPSIGPEDHEGDGRLREEESGQAGLRLGGPRQHPAHAHRDAEVPGRHRHPARALSRRGRRAERSAGRPDPDDERDQRAAARQGRQAEPALHEFAGPLAGISRHADADRGRAIRIRTCRAGTRSGRRSACRPTSSTSCTRAWSRS